MASAAAKSSPTKYVVANLDEGDPGAYIDRFIAELDPFCLLEGMAIAARAIGADAGWIYVRCEYPQAIAILEQAIAAAQSTGPHDQGFLRTGFRFNVNLMVGRGSYLCGEETAMLNSIEHRRPVGASARPTFPTADFTAVRHLSTMLKRWPTFPGSSAMAPSSMPKWGVRPAAVRRSCR